MKDLRVDKRTIRVFVLSEDENRIVYIPLTSLHRQDYDRLLEIEKKAGRAPMIDEMRKTTLENGKNALTLYDSIIQVMNIKSVDPRKVVHGDRLIKPSEPNYVSAEEVEAQQFAEENGLEQDEQEVKKPARKKPGPPKGYKRKKPEEQASETTGSGDIS